MTLSATLAFLHHAAAFLLVGMLMVKMVLLKGELTLVNVRSLVRMDAIAGSAASVLLLVGLARVFHAEKGADYYFRSAPFLLKLALFITVAFLSIYPTLQLRSWRKSLEQPQPMLDDGKRRRVRLIIHLELLAAFLIMLFAVLMARGIGFIG